MSHIHFIGIGGTGISAIARLLKESGAIVSGSDMQHSPYVNDLREIGITVYIGHQAKQIGEAEVIVRSSAIPDTNPEVVAARKAGTPVYKRADFLGRLMENKIGIAVAGTHGKTSTTAMLAWTLTELGEDPSFILGSTINELGVNGHFGAGKTFVIEADEYDRMFLGLKPTIGIVTNLEHDHPDIYPTAENFRQAFVDFIHLLPADGAYIYCADDPGATDLAKNAKVETIAYSLQNANPAPNTRGGFDFTFHATRITHHVSLQVPGRHNVWNALAVMTVIAKLGLPLDKAADALGRFTGTGRRFELVGEQNGIAVYDDYAHHPTEIRATLAAARARYPQAGIWAVWQPHTYSRTQLLFDEFAKSFSDADHVIATEVYRSREPKQDFSSAQIVDAMDHPSAHFIAALDDVSAYLLENLQPNDILLVLSAGDAVQISTNVLKGLGFVKK